MNQLVLWTHTLLCFSPQFYCAKDAQSPFVRVEEPSTCDYRITIHSKNLCSHPLFKAEEKTQSVEIVCAPALKKAQYEKYMKKMQSKFLFLILLDLCIMLMDQHFIITGLYWKLYLYPLNVSLCFEDTYNETLIWLTAVTKNRRSRFPGGLHLDKWFYKSHCLVKVFLSQLYSSLHINL